MIIQLKSEDIVLEPKARGLWCTLPYYNHPKGCPNFGKKVGCPPFSPKFEEVYMQPFYMVMEFFDIETHVIKMKEKHPKWTEKQCRSLLYWQKNLNKKLENNANEFMKKLSTKNIELVKTPEAMGINMFETCKNVGVLLERNPKKMVIKIVIIAIRKDKS